MTRMTVLDSGDNKWGADRCKCMIADKAADSISMSPFWMPCIPYFFFINCHATSTALVIAYISTHIYIHMHVHLYICTYITILIMQNIDMNTNNDTSGRRSDRSKKMHKLEMVPNQA